MADRVQDLSRRLDEIHQEYRQHFAGRSRVSREPERLDQMVQRVQALIQEATGVEGTDQQLLPLAREREQLYDSERKQIREAQAGGPDVAEAARLSDWSFLLLRRYGRNFAGHPRPTRDLSLLDEMIDEQRRFLRRFEDLAARKEAGWQEETGRQLRENLALFEKERKAIADAWRDLSASEKVSSLARRANDQFSNYRRHFESKARKTRPVALLQRIIDSLVTVHGEMLAVKQGGFKSDANDGNIQKVDDRIHHFRRELSQVQQARGQMRPGELSAELANEANALFQRYREQFGGRSRREVDPDALHDICEQLQVLARQMDALNRESGLPANEKNLGVVIDNLKRYEREFVAILDAKRSV